MSVKHEGRLMALLGPHQGGGSSALGAFFPEANKWLADTLGITALREETVGRLHPDLHAAEVAQGLYERLGGKAAEDRGMLWYPNSREKYWHPGNESVPGGDRPSCDGIASKCPFGRNTGCSMCWRVSYRNKIKEFSQNGVFVQVVENTSEPLGQG
eukprot:CAMPEP_0117593266 /NCGR_PEP_ID=MMETSP0784-20121206/72539_1 /TAXON_ID=39447 /ORGANISM="" /LENGTH=155 /DNA_ID=CAMNT_0005395173 /DNA_START=61 /DNA_END=528 /DNA_ORIENTATION=-